MKTIIDSQGLALLLNEQHYSISYQIHLLCDKIKSREVERYFVQSGRTSSEGGHTFTIYDISLEGLKFYSKNLRKGEQKKRLNAFLFDLKKGRENPVTITHQTPAPVVQKKVSEPTPIEPEQNQPKTIEYQFKMREYQHYSDKTIKEVIRLYKEGKSGPAIESALGLKPYAAHSIMRRKDVQAYLNSPDEISSFNRITPDIEKVIIDQYESGRSIASLSKEHKVSSRTVQHILAKNDIQLKPKYIQNSFYQVWKAFFEKDVAYTTFSRKIMTLLSLEPEKDYVVINKNSGRGNQNIHVFTDTGFDKIIDHADYVINSLKVKRYNKGGFNAVTTKKCEPMDFFKNQETQKKVEETQEIVAAAKERIENATPIQNEFLAKQIEELAKEFRNQTEIFSNRFDKIEASIQNLTVQSIIQEQEPVDELPPLNETWEQDTFQIVQDIATAMTKRDSGTSYGEAMEQVNNYIYEKVEDISGVNLETEAYELEKETMRRKSKFDVIANSEAMSRLYIRIVEDTRKKYNNKHKDEQVA